jgi:endonuclease/exonuclease/phosphatase (EEP) superfamily protein YafD
MRDSQLAALAQHVQQISEPVLVVGDFNATPWSVGMRHAMRGNLGFRSLDAPWQPTWQSHSILAIPIDHALCTSPLVITHRSLGRDVGSDHRPLEIVVGMELGP